VLGWPGVSEGLFNRDSGAWFRSCSLLATTILAFSAPGAMLRSSPFAIVAALAGAVAFATNLRQPVSRRSRRLAAIVQVLSTLSMLGLIVAALSVAGSGRRGWDEAPLWAWVVMSVLPVIFGVATADGIRAYRNEEP
jgi:cytochrome bd-type quinol oxidase subunit 2